MPNRILKESFLTSERIASLSDFEFRLWTALIVMADDYGRGLASPAIIKGRAFPYKERLPLSDITKALANLAAHDCIELYEVDGRSFYAFPRWSAHQNVRAKRSRYPAPDGSMEAPASICMQMNARAPVIQSNPYPNPIQNARARARDYQCRKYSPEDFAAMEENLDE